LKLAQLCCAPEMKNQWAPGRQAGTAVTAAAVVDAGPSRTIAAAAAAAASASGRR